jgi:hypothetical protein
MMRRTGGDSVRESRDGDVADTLAVVAGKGRNCLFSGVASPFDLDRADGGNGG